MEKDRKRQEKKGSKYAAGDRIRMKKPHACGSNDWRIERTGVDIKLLCLGCGHSLWIKRRDFDRKVRKILCADGRWVPLAHYSPEAAGHSPQIHASRAHISQTHSSRVKLGERGNFSDPETRTAKEIFRTQAEKTSCKEENNR